MAADDELPRGWTQSAQSALGSTATVTFPAIPGIAWVLTAATGTLLAVNAGGATYPTALEVNGAAVAFIGEIPQSQGETSDGSYPGESWQFPVSTAVTVTLTAPNANLEAFVSASAYPV